MAAPFRPRFRNMHGRKTLAFEPSSAAQRGANVTPTGEGHRRLMAADAVAAHPLGAAGTAVDFAVVTPPLEGQQGVRAA